MNTHPMKLVTIVCEAYALTAVKKLLKEAGAHGWTHFPVEGAGDGGERTAGVVQEIERPPQQRTLHGGGQIAICRGRL